MSRLRDRLRDRLRFGFVLFHLTAVTVLSVPAPVGARMDATWKERHVRSQVLEWVAPFRSLLGDRSDEQVLTLARAVATRILNARDLVIAPFVPYARTVGAGQGWQMFGSLNDQLAALKLYQTENGLWRTIVDDETSYEEVSASAGIAAAVIPRTHGRSGSWTRSAHARR